MQTDVDAARCNFSLFYDADRCRRRVMQFLSILRHRSLSMLRDTISLLSSTHIPFDAVRFSFLFLDENSQRRRSVSFNIRLEIKGCLSVDHCVMHFPENKECNSWKRFPLFSMGSLTFLTTFWNKGCFVFFGAVQGTATAAATKQILSLQKIHIPVAPSLSLSTPKVPSSSLPLEAVVDQPNHTSSPNAAYLKSVAAPTIPEALSLSPAIWNIREEDKIGLQCVGVNMVE